jgi:hypothetical protein
MFIPQNRQRSPLEDTQMKNILALLIFLSGFTAQIALAQQSDLGGLNPGALSKISDGSITCYVVTKSNRVTGQNFTSSISCIGDTSHLTSATSFLDGKVTRIQDADKYCYIYSAMTTNSISCVK